MGLRVRARDGDRVKHYIRKVFGEVLFARVGSGLGLGIRIIRDRVVVRDRVGFTGQG